MSNIRISGNLNTIENPDTLIKALEEIGEQRKLCEKAINIIDKLLETNAKLRQQICHFPNKVICLENIRDDGRTFHTPSTPPIDCHTIATETNKTKKSES